MDYQRRIIDGVLDEHFSALPAILLEGAKGVGKTATALQRSRTVWRLDNESDREIIEANLQLATNGPSPVLLDEWQHTPEVWNAVKRAVDDDMSGGRFLLTGSAPGVGTREHSGAGRVTFMKMRPMTLPERGIGDASVSLGALLEGSNGEISGSCSLTITEYVDEICSTGFPGIRQVAPRSRPLQIDSYVKRLVERDVLDAGVKLRRPEVLLSWLKAFAAATATTTSWEKIRAAATPGYDTKPTRDSTIIFVSTLQLLGVLDDVESWTPSSNRLHRLAQSPKHFLVDPGLAARLVGVNPIALLRPSASATDPVRTSFLGPLFESLVALSLQVFAQANESRIFHFRSREGRREIDFIVERPDGRVVAIEVKAAQNVNDHDVRHLMWLKNTLGEKVIDALIVTTGSVAYRRADGVGVVPLGLLGH